MRQVEQTGESLIITDHGKPTLELKPYRAEQTKEDPMTYLRGVVVEYIDPEKPVAEDEWESLT